MEGRPPWPPPNPGSIPERRALGSYFGLGLLYEPLVFANSAHRGGGLYGDFAVPSVEGAGCEALGFGDLAAYGGGAANATLNLVEVEAR
jgi:hypothetical protein